MSAAAGSCHGFRDGRLAGSVGEGFLFVWGFHWVGGGAAIQCERGFVEKLRDLVDLDGLLVLALSIDQSILMAKATLRIWGLQWKVKSIDFIKRLSIRAIDMYMTHSFNMIYFCFGCQPCFNPFIP